MSGPRPQAVALTERQRALLTALAHSATAPHAQVQRAQLLLAAAAGERTAPLARRLGLHRETVRAWRARWAALAPTLCAQEAADPAEPPLRDLLVSLLRDAPRAGAPPTFSAEQLVQIVALGCEDPVASGRPVSHWTPRELAEEAVKRGIVPTISPRSVGRFLKSGRTQAPFEPLLAQSQARRARGVCGAGGDDL